jgi:hypothetical protein
MFENKTSKKIKFVRFYEKSILKIPASQKENRPKPRGG